MNLLKSIAALVIQKREEIILPSDSTLYDIETNKGKYHGRIIYQDDVVIRLLTSTPKPVKILKSNIGRLSVSHSEVAQQYFQKRNAQL